jgi:hypothetical protein
MDPSTTTQPAKPPFERWWLVGSLVGGGLLLVQLGMLLAALDSPIYHVTRDGVAAARAMIEQNQLSSYRWPAHLWNETRHIGGGVARYDVDAALPGWTAYSSGHDSVVIVVDGAGEEVHRWHAPYSQVFDSGAAVWRGIPDHCIFIRKFHIDANGDILVQYETPVSSPNGCGLAKLDRDGNVLWTYDRFAHHDFDVGDDGTIYALTHDIRDEPHPGFVHLGSPIIEDKVAVLSAEGRELATFSLFDALADTAFDRPVVTLRDHHGDIFHSNTVKVVSEEFAAHYDEVRAGDLMVCLRNLNLVVAVSRDSGRAVWGTSGPWHFPHDPDLLDNGHILIFDNCHTLGAEAISRVIEFDPATSDIVWSYSHSDATQPLVSQIRSNQQLLANGNVLITESDHGRLLEVTPSCEVAWEFLNPHRGGDQQELTAVVSGGTRYTSSELPFLSHLSLRESSAGRESDVPAGYETPSSNDTPTRPSRSEIRRITE